MSIEHKVTCGCKVTPCCFYLSKKPLQWNKLNNYPVFTAADGGVIEMTLVRLLHHTWNSVSSVELHLHLFLMFTFLWWSLSSWKIQEKSLRSVFFTDLFTDFTDLFTDSLLLYWPLLSRSPSWYPVFSVLLKSLKHWSYALGAWIIQMDVPAD